MITGRNSLLRSSRNSALTLVWHICDARPQSNGLAEKAVRTIKDYLDSSSGASLEAIVKVYNYTQHWALSENESSNEFFFGCQSRTPFNSFKPRAVVAIPLSEYQERFEEDFDRRQGVTRRRFDKGESVSIELHNESRVPGSFPHLSGKECSLSLSRAKN